MNTALLAKRRWCASSLSHGILRRRAVAEWDVNEYAGTGPLFDVTGNGHDARFGSAFQAYLSPGGFLRLPGTAGNYASSPDSAVLDITGDLDIRVKVAATDWTPAATQTLISKWGTSQKSYRIDLRADGGLNFIFTTDGSTDKTRASTVAALPFSDGAIGWVRVTLDADNGASGHDVKFYHSTDGETWTQFGATVTTAGATTIHSGTAEVKIGQVDAVQPFAGKFYRAQIASGIVGVNGPFVFDVDFTSADYRRGVVTESANGAEVTIHTGGARLAGGFLFLPGTASNFAETRDTAGLSITGDIDLRVKVALTDWDAAGTQVLVGKYASTGNQRSYRFYTVAGTFGFQTSVDGSAIRSDSATTPHGITDGTAKWVRVTRTTAGAVAFYTSDDGSTWTQNGTTVAGTSGNIFASSTALQVGAREGSSDLAAGKFYRTQVYSGIGGTKVFDVDFTGPHNRRYVTDSVSGNRVWIRATGGADSNDPVFLDYEGERSIYCPGLTGNYASTNHLGITSDLDVRVRVSPNVWNSGAVQALAGDRWSQNNSGWRLSLNSGSFTFQWVQTASATRITQVTQSGVTDGEAKYLRVTFDADDGAGSHAVTFYTSSDYDPDTATGTWTQIGAPQTATGGGTASIIAGASGGVQIGAANNLDHIAGKLYRAQVYNGIAGTLALDIDFTDVSAYASGLGSLTAVTGQTVTLNRASTGEKLSVVDRKLLLFGTDAYLEVDDHPDLDFAATDPFTVLVAGRRYGTGVGVLFASRDSAAGWQLQITTTDRLQFLISDGTNSPFAATANSTISAGLAQVWTGRRSVTDDQVAAFVDGASVATATDSTTATLANSNTKRIGRSAGSATNYTDFEFFRAALVREDLTDAEIERSGYEMRAAA